MNETRTLATFLANLRYQDLPRGVIAQAKRTILEQIGLQIALSTKPYLHCMLDYSRASGCKGECTIVNYGDKTTAENASLVNATFAHGFEFDDVHRKSLSHPGVVIVPAAMAIAERERASGVKLILSVVAGYEGMCRPGSAIAESCLDRGFHTTPVPGPLGSAAAVGSLLKLDSDKMLHALSIAASCSSGLTEYQVTAGEVKRLHAGIASQGGLRSAQLAGFGMTGPTTALEGPNGWCRAFSDKYDLSEITSGLGERFSIMEVWTKRYCCNGFLLGPIEIIKKMRQEHPFALDEVAEVVMGGCHRAPREVGFIREPKDMTGFQFSANYLLALVLVKGSADYSDVSEENLHDPEIAKMAQRIRLEEDPEVDRLYPVHIASSLTVRLKDGTVLHEFLQDCKGTPENPMTTEEMRAKFNGLALTVFPKGQVDKIADQVDALESLDDVRQLTGLLTR